MARTENRLRSQLKLPASLIDRTHSGGKAQQNRRVTIAKKTTAEKTIKKTNTKTFRKVATRSRSKQ